MEQYFCKTKLIVGDGAMGALKDMGAKRLFVVTDPFFSKDGTAQRVAQLAGAKETAFFDKIVPDPTVELAAEGTAAMRRFEPDVLVALGGGSAMDCAKAMVFFSGLEVLFVAIPTTSGSGSEVTNFSILTHNDVKHPVVDDKMQPDVAILDSQLLGALPKRLIAEGGFDVLCHSLEAFVATGAGMITDALAKEAFCCAYAQLPASYGGNQSVRLRIHTAATVAGMAFTQAGLGLCHAMAHSLGGAFHLPHGRLNAILLPSVINCNAEAAGDKYAAIAAAAGIGGSAHSIAVRNLRNALIRLRKALDLPATLYQAGVDPQQVRRSSKELVAATLADPCCNTNPVAVQPWMVHRILEEVTGDG